MHYYNKYDVRSTFDQLKKEIVEARMAGDPKWELLNESFEHKFASFDAFRKAVSKNVNGIISNDAFLMDGKRYRAVAMPKDFYISNKPELADLNKAVTRAYSELVQGSGLTRAAIEDVMKLRGGIENQVEQVISDVVGQRFIKENRLNYGGYLYLPEDLVSAVKQVLPFSDSV